MFVFGQYIDERYTGMSIEQLIQYGTIVISLVALFLDREGTIKYIPVALFASLYANIWCYIANCFHLWTYQDKLFSIVQDISATANLIVVPILAIIWIKHIPNTLIGKYIWAFVWTTGLTLFQANNAGVVDTSLRSPPLVPAKIQLRGPGGSAHF